MNLGGAEPEQQAEAPAPAAPQDETALSVVQRVMARLEKGVEHAQPEPPQTAPPIPPPSAEPVVSREELTAEITKEILAKLSGEDGLEYMLRHGVDPTAMVDKLVDQANAGPRGRAHDAQLREVNTKLEELTKARTADAEQRERAAAQRQQQQHQDDVLDAIEDSPEKYPHLSAETEAQRVARVQSAAKTMVALGEGATATLADILELAEVKLERYVKRLSGVRPEVEQAAVGAGEGSREPTTLSGSIAGERTVEGELPVRGTSEFRERLIRRATELGM